LIHSYHDSGQGWALACLEDYEAAITTLNESAAIFDELAYAPGAAQAQNMLTAVLESAASGNEAV
jgi:hypothetical protein